MAVDKSDTLLIRQSVASIELQAKRPPPHVAGVDFLFYNLKVINYKSDCKACHLDSWLTAKLGTYAKGDLSTYRAKFTKAGCKF